MKRIIAFCMAVLSVMVFTGCGGKEQKINITIPAGTPNEFVYDNDLIYSEEEIKAEKNTMTLTVDENFTGEYIILKPTFCKEENAYEPMFMEAGSTVETDVEKGARFKIGVAMGNTSDEDKEICVTVKGAKVLTE